VALIVAPSADDGSAVAEIIKTHRQRFDSAEEIEPCTFSSRCTPLRRRVCRTPTTTAAAAHILSSIKTITDINDGQTDPAVSPAMLLAFAIVSATPAKITSIRNMWSAENETGIAC